MKLNNNELIAVIVGLGFVIAFIFGISTATSAIMLEKINAQRLLNDSLITENTAIKIENEGLWNLIKIKDNQFIGHYTHTEIKSDFRVINKR